MAQNANRPLSPHLMSYRWTPQMAISIFHRATGFLLATAGMLVFLWWLAAIGGSAESFATFQTYVVDGGRDATTWQTAGNWFFRLLAVALIYSFFLHLFAGVRHLLLDTGAGYQLQANKNSALAAFIAAIFATALVVLFVASRVLEL